MRRGSRVVRIVRGLNQDDGAMLTLGIVMALAGPNILDLLTGRRRKRALRQRSRDSR